MTDPALLTLVQWLSPAFPVGGYAYSHGLEWAISVGDVTGAGVLEHWLSDVLRFGAGWNDGLLLSHAMREETDIAALADLAVALAPSRERLAETLDQGRALIATTNALRGQDWPAMPYPVALGAAARGLGLQERQVTALYLHSFASNLVQAAVRFMPLGQTEGQRVLAALHQPITQVAAEVTEAPLDALGSAALRGDLAAMCHETMEVRIFRT